jgi:hypothetical protein
MNIPLIGQLNWSDWLRGVIGGFIGGGAAAITSAGTLTALDPAYFAQHPPGFVMTLMGTLFITNGVIGMMLYLKQNPVPGVKEVTTTVETVKQAVPQGPKVTTTVQEKTTEPIPPPKP